MMRYDVTIFLKEIHDKKTGGFRFCPRGETTLLSTCFGVQLCYLINALEIMDREQIVSGIQGQQQDDGFFLDCDFKKSELSGLQDDSYLQWQFTFFSLIALDMLGAEPRHPLRFLDKYLDEFILESWFEKRNWLNFWYSSNEIMFLFYFLTFKDRKNELSRTGRAIEQLFILLDRKQDAETGYWGDEVRKNPVNGMYGAAHIYLFYDFFGKKIRHESEIVRSTMDLQGDEGLYGPNGGGACEDYDGVEILVRMLNQNQRNSEIIQKSLRATYHTIVRAQCQNGGFPYRIPCYSPKNALQRFLNMLQGRNTYCYSGWSKMKSNVYHPDIWATYFRTLSIAIIEKSLELSLSYPYRSYQLPGWGYLFNRP